VDASFIYVLRLFFFSLRSSSRHCTPYGLEAIWPEVVCFHRVRRPPCCGAGVLSQRVWGGAVETDGAQARCSRVCQQRRGAWGGRGGAAGVHRRPAVLNCVRWLPTSQRPHRPAAASPPPHLYFGKPRRTARACAIELLFLQFSSICARISAPEASVLANDWARNQQSTNQIIFCSKCATGRVLKKRLRPAATVGRRPAAAVGRSVCVTKPSRWVRPPWAAADPCALRSAPGGGRL